MPPLPPLSQSLYVADIRTQAQVTEAASVPTQIWEINKLTGFLPLGLATPFVASDAEMPLFERQKIAQSDRKMGSVTKRTESRRPAKKKYLLSPENAPLLSWEIGGDLANWRIKHPAEQSNHVERRENLITFGATSFTKNSRFS